MTSTYPEAEEEARPPCTHTHTHTHTPRHHPRARLRPCAPDDVCAGSRAYPLWGDHSLSFDVAQGSSATPRGQHAAPQQPQHLALRVSTLVALRTKASAPSSRPIAHQILIKNNRSMKRALLGQASLESLESIVAQQEEHANPSQLAPAPAPPPAWSSSQMTETATGFDTAMARGATATATASLEEPGLETLHLASQERGSKALPRSVTKKPRLDRETKARLIGFASAWIDRPSPHASVDVVAPHNSVLESAHVDIEETSMLVREGSPQVTSPQTSPHSSTQSSKWAGRPKRLQPLAARRV